jgi:hypothetical protein
VFACRANTAAADTSYIEACVLAHSGQSTAADQALSGRQYLVGSVRAESQSNLAEWLWKRTQKPYPVETVDGGARHDFFDRQMT